VDRVSPRESTYRWRDVSHLHEAAQAIPGALLEQYRQYGLAPEAGMEDHLAVELELLAFLCQREAAGWQANLPKAARDLRHEESLFVEQHLGAWLPEFCWRMAERGSQSFYARLAALANAWLALDMGPKYRSGAR
jgi:TorA maturation chaperone TorD